MSLRISTAYNVTSSYQEYKKALDSYTSSSDSIEIPGCDNFNNKHINGSTYDPSRVCTIAIKFLIHLKEKYVSSYGEEGCRYLYYWLYVKALESKKTTENTLDLYKKLNEVFNEHNDGNYMFDEYINKMDKDTCNKTQKIIHLYEVFNIFENQEPSDVEEKKCTSKCAEIFTSYVNECREEYDYDFCNELKNFREYHNFFIRKLRNCEGDKYFLPPVENFDIVGMIILPFVLILVTSLILPLLYKFTPIGPWIRHRLVKKKNVWDDMQQDENHLLRNYEMQKDNSIKPYYKIAYNSS
ncbi:Plasmodium vivax Vir protein, putative [Plasmodium ovale]|uniref:Plasmodium vivax Vir protein, putative n=1 Tax=Plasmodium ovale TaxID=36330 RepID=A0A1C3KIY7_PLAOA|nr:Plasmodium vivax Vir protein, putative [Plasmodium ovale]